MQGGGRCRRTWLFVEDSFEIVVADQAVVAEGVEESEFLGFVALGDFFFGFEVEF
jgi:hypothetical protein